MRIAGGSLRGRVVAAPPGRAVRPTSARVRAALFDILAHNNWPGGLGERGAAWPFAHVLDAFAGSGALGIEALSRGAERAVFFEADRQQAAALRRALEALGLAARAEVCHADALRPPAAGTGAADLVLLDPPYGRGLAEPALAALDRAGWIGRPAVVALELPRREEAPVVTDLAVAIDRRYGDTRLVVLSRG